MGVFENSDRIFFPKFWKHRKKKLKKQKVLEDFFPEFSIAEETNSNLGPSISLQRVVTYSLAITICQKNLLVNTTSTTHSRCLPSSCNQATERCSRLTPGLPSSL